MNLHGKKFVHDIFPCINEMIACQTDGFIETGCDWLVFSERYMFFLQKCLNLTESNSTICRHWTWRKIISENEVEPIIIFGQSVLKLTNCTQFWLIDSRTSMYKYGYLGYWL